MVPGEGPCWQFTEISLCSLGKLATNCVQTQKISTYGVTLFLHLCIGVCRCLQVSAGCTVQTSWAGWDICVCLSSSGVIVYNVDLFSEMTIFTVLQIGQIQKSYKSLSKMYESLYYRLYISSIRLGVTSTRHVHICCAVFYDICFRTKQAVGKCYISY